MKLKTFLILLVICAILGGVAYLTTQKTPVASGPQLGDALFKTLPINDIAEIALISHNGQATLKRDNRWNVIERYQYPADFDKIRDFVKKVSEVKIGNVFEASDDAIARLGLVSPEQADSPIDVKGTRVTLKDKDGVLLADIIFGKPRQTGTGGGHYLRYAAEKSIYLIDQSFLTIDSKPEDWLNKEVVNIAPNDIAAATCYAPDSDQALYRLKRPEKGQNAEFENPPTGKTIKSAKINSVIGALSSLRCVDVIDPSQQPEEIGMAAPYRFEYQHFDGTVYRVRISAPAAGDEAEPKRYLSLEAAYTPPPKAEPPTDSQSPATATPTETESETASTEPDDEKNPEQLAADAESLNQQIKGWTYLIPKWKAEAFETQIATFIETPENN